MRRASLSLLVAGTIGATAATAAPTTMPDWVEAYTREALTAPVTVENALKYRWYQIGVAIRSEHPFVYDIDIAPATAQLRRHGNAVSSELKQQLDARFSVVPSLEQAGPFTAQCGWIMARERGEGPTQVQLDLDAYCRDRAIPALYVRLVRERARAFDVRLPTLRTLDVSYPSRLIGTSGSVGREDVPAAFAKALEERLNTAQPSVVGELAAHFRAAAIGDAPLQTDAAVCRDLLGPWYPRHDPVRDMALSDPLRSAEAGGDAALRFGQAISDACRREAKAWLMRQQPAIDTAIRAGFAAIDPNQGPILSVRARCTAVLGRWFASLEGFELTLTGPLQQTCQREARALNERAVDIHAKAVTARFVTAARSVAGLEQNGWFEPSADDLQTVHDPRDPDWGEVDRLMRARTQAMIQPSRDAARNAAVSEIADLYGQAHLTDAELQPARRVCEPYLAKPTRTLPSGGGSVRDTIREACREQENRVGLRRAEKAVAVAGIETVLGKGRLVLTAPDGGLSYVDPRALVIAAAANGLQVTFERTSSWFFWTRERVRITSLGRDNPVLSGDLTADRHPTLGPVWRVTELQELPGLAGPLATLACVAQGQQAVDTLLTLGLAGAASLFIFDAPRTGAELIGIALDGVAGATRCETARRGYFAAPSASAS
ncbi:hypothetical protein GOFOIKOB_5201 [Methylobacterium tardum]|uniref:Uncharacterized protein n=1 Tax=Methylobacterium tardum TaxID=374432 RepID=A0AA37WSE0_9HYPH|nr:hypothetical protein [Methylobacterium tardum]URD38115.1 hypothetical protein M6G65_06475 [Methylobacterium tardum]GJE52133.1 hypothetical protein GOFOIKOB_5201 [Methylobacterium tardum]GLS71695.1 hypothetical protein GCM10007890_37080 [Methylobacterium tardum]